MLWSLHCNYMHFMTYSSANSIIGEQWKRLTKRTNLQKTQSFQYVQNYCFSGTTVNFGLGFFPFFQINTNRKNKQDTRCHQGILHPLTMLKVLSNLRQKAKKNKTYRTISKEDSRILRSLDNKTAKCFVVGSQKLEVTVVMKIVKVGHFTASVGDSLPKCDAQKERNFCRQTWSSSHFSQKIGRRKMQFSSLQIVQQNLTLGTTLKRQTD